MGCSNDVSRTVDDGHTLLHVILHLELVNVSFSECAISPEKRTASEPNTAPQALCVRERVRSEVKQRRPRCCTESTHGSWETSLGLLTLLGR